MSRIFKTAWFTRTARKAGIRDDELLAVIKQIERGQVADLGGGVFKKRLNKNRHRAIVIVKAENFFFYEYLFAKKDRDNIGRDELAAFRQLAKAYAGISDRQLVQLINNGDLTEIGDA